MARSPAFAARKRAWQPALTRGEECRNLRAVMSRQSWPILLTLCATLPRAARADDAPLAVAPQPGVVLLRNGQVLAGNVTQAGEEYYVALASGEIRLQAQQVELVCRDVKEGYERKRARIDPEKVSDHLDLALWCVRQQLFAESAQEISDARGLNSAIPRIARSNAPVEARPGAAAAGRAKARWRRRGALARGSRSTAARHAARNG